MWYYGIVSQKGPLEKSGQSVYWLLCIIAYNYLRIYNCPNKNVNLKIFD